MSCVVNCHSYFVVVLNVVVVLCCVVLCETMCNAVEVFTVVVVVEGCILLSLCCVVLCCGCGYKCGCGCRLRLCCG